jgi:hypothetical protein
MRGDNRAFSTAMLESNLKQSASGLFRHRRHRQVGISLFMAMNCWLWRIHRFSAEAANADPAAASCGADDIVTIGLETSAKPQE